MELHGSFRVTIICFLVIFVHSKVHYKILKMECIPNLRYLQNHTCQVKAINRYISGIYMQCHLAETLRDLAMRLKGYQKNDRNRWNPFLINVEGKICPLLAKKVYTPYLTSIMKHLETCSNFNHSCPFEPGPLVVRNLTLDSRSMLPNFLPTGDYKITMVFTEGRNQTFVGEANVYFQTINEDNYRRPSNRKNSSKKIR